MTDPIEDIKKAFGLLKEEPKRPYEPLKTIHHPKCRCVETRNIYDCNCGGLFR